nr:hypothetical protein [uncultured Actinoplanes sp.]
MPLWLPLVVQPFRPLPLPAMPLQLSRLPVGVGAGCARGLAAQATQALVVALDQPPRAVALMRAPEFLAPGRIVPCGGVIAHSCYL